ncbi:MAG TPA: hypothetical protein VGH63_19115, partial [Polyangia bacterium]
MLRYPGHEQAGDELGKVIDVEFRVNDRGRWCVRCDEPFPEGTAMCPRCGGELASAARHRAEMQARARKKARRYVATGAGLALFVAAAVAWLLFGPGVGVARGDERTAAGTATATKQKKEKVAAAAPVAAARPSDGGMPVDAIGESTPVPNARAVRVRLLDGSTVVGTVHAEEAAMLVIDCSLGVLSIPRGRISTIAYDAAAGVGQK